MASGTRSRAPLLLFCPPMEIQLARARRTLAPALLVAALASACAKVEDGPPGRADTALAAAAVSSPISDKSLRPPPEGAEPVIKLRGMPAQDTAIVRTDTPLAVPVARPAVSPAPELRVETDVAVLMRELAVPVAGIAASALHDTYNEPRGGTRPHEALDILAPRGTPVLSAANGRVLKLFTSKPGGLMVYAADSSERFILKYGHLDAYTPGLADGQTLRQGQQIGVVGTTGNAAANTPHLHFAIAHAADVTQWWKGTPVNPYPLLKP